MPVTQVAEAGESKASDLPELWNVSQANLGSLVKLGTLGVQLSGKTLAWHL